MRRLQPAMGPGFAARPGSIPDQTAPPGTGSAHGPAVSAPAANEGDPARGDSRELEVLLFPPAGGAEIERQLQALRLPLAEALSDASRTGARVLRGRPSGFLKEFGPYLTPYRKRGARLLDAAAGEGGNLESLLTLRAEVHACDASPHALAKIPAAVRQRVRMAVCDLAHLPFADGYFDGVLATDVIETLPDPGPALRELRRVLRPRGRLLCNIADLENGIDGVEMPPMEANHSLFRDRVLCRSLTEYEALELLIAHGFEILKRETRCWMEEPYPGSHRARPCHSRIFLAEKPELTLADLKPAESMEAPR